MSQQPYILEIDMPITFEVIGGKCGRAIMKLGSLADYLADLSDFIERQRHELPKRLVAKKKTIDNYLKETEMYIGALRRAYLAGYMEAVRVLCNEAWEVAEEIEAFLESIKDLRQLHAIDLILR